MRNIEAAGQLHYANRIGRILLQAMEANLGRDDWHTLLHQNELSHFITMPPADDLQREFDFETLARLDSGLDAMYGPRGGRKMARQTGRSAFDAGLQVFGPLLGVSSLIFRVLPLDAKLRIGLPLLARLFNQYTDQVTHIESYSDHYIYSIDRCPVCWGRENETPICDLAGGVLEEALTWVSGGATFQVDEIRCIATGDDACAFRVEKQPVQSPN